MKLADCYRLLGLKEGASYDEIKAAYRRLARRYHPDMNPGSVKAKDTFIQLTDAYHKLIDAAQPSILKARRKAQTATQPTTAQAAKPGATPKPAATQPKAATQSKAAPQPKSTAQATAKPATATSIRKRPVVQRDPNTSASDQQMKEKVFEMLQRSLQEQRYPRAIALVEGLAQRLPQDGEVRQWLAVVYQRWGRHLVNHRQFDKAKIFLNKALRTDPHNRTLWYEVDRDMRRIDGIEIM